METQVVPNASPAPLPELETNLRPFAPLFRCATSRESLERYVTGWLTDLRRKNCDTIAAVVAGTSTERLHHLLTDATWDPQALDQERVRALVAHSPSKGILVLDDHLARPWGQGTLQAMCRCAGALGHGWRAVLYHASSRLHWTRGVVARRASSARRTW